MRSIVFSYVAEKSFRTAFISGRCPAAIKNTQWVKFAHRNIVTSVSEISSKQYAHRHRHVVLLPAQPRYLRAQSRTMADMAFILRCMSLASAIWQRVRTRLCFGFLTLKYLLPTI